MTNTNADVAAMVARLRFELRDWNGKERTLMVPVNALTVSKAAALLQSQQAEITQLSALLEERSAEGHKAPVCNCTTHCLAPRIMGRQTSCLRSRTIRPGQAISTEDK